MIWNYSILKKVSSLFFVIVLGCIQLISAQNNQELPYRLMGVDQGLSQSTATGFLQDSLGFMWITTRDGLNRYDGLNMKVFNNEHDNVSSLSNGWINKMIFDDKGLMWLGTSRGLNKFNYDTEHFVSVFTDTSATDTLKGLPDNYIFDLFCDSQGRVWVSTLRGLVFTKDGESFIRPKFMQNPEFPANDAVYRISEGKDGTLWLGMFTNGVVSVSSDLSQFNFFQEIKTNAGKIQIGKVQAIHQDVLSDNVWLSMERNGLYKVDFKKGSGKFYSIIEESEEDEADLTATILEDSAGTLWFGNSHGVFTYNNSKDEFELKISTKKMGLTSPQVMSLFIDKTENLWIGTEMSGVIVADLKPRKFHKVDNKLLSNSVIWAMYEDIDGSLWVGTEIGVDILNKEKTAGRFFIDARKAPVPTSITAITGNDETIWVGTLNAGIIEIDRKTLKYKYIETGVYADSRFISSLLYDKEDRILYIGSFNGMGFYNLNTKQSSWFKVGDIQKDSLALPSRAIVNLYKDHEGRIWMNHDAGISFMDSKTNRFTHLSLLPDNDNPKANISTLYITEDMNGFHWIGAENSLIKYDIRKDTILRTFTVEDGLANAFVYGILVSNDNSIWISTNRGLSTLIPDSTKTTGYLIKNYSTSDGLQSLEFNSNAVLEQRDGQMLFGGIKGINYFQPEKIYINRFEASPFISELTINDGRSQNKISLKHSNHVSVDYGANVYEINVHALEYTEPLKNKFISQLSGFEPSWNEMQGQSKVIYTNLSPGLYNFTLKMANSDGYVSKISRSFTLEIVPPFYMTKFFYAIVVVSLLLLLFIGTDYRARKLKENNDYLEKEVANRARELEKNQFVFKQISDNAADLISMLDKNGEIIYANPAHFGILGYNEADLAKYSILNLIHPDDLPHVLEQVKKIETGEKIVFIDYRIKHKDGHWLSMQTAGSVTRFVDEDQDYNFIFVSHDATQQKEIERNLIESRNDALKASQAKSAFLAGISHELRTPLNAILGFSQILVKEKNLNDKQLTYVNTMLKSGNHLLNMINEVLDISRIEAGKMPLNYDSLSIQPFLKDIDGLFRLDAQKKGLELINDYQPDIPDFFFMDAGKLRQIIINLVGNALKFTQNGYIGLKLSYEEERLHPFLNWESIVASAEKHEISEMKRGVLKFEIRDSGIGIAKEKIDQIFEPFLQAETEKTYVEGTGLGLAISSRLVKLLGGTIQVHSVFGKGTQFECALPVLVMDVPNVATLVNNERIIGIKGTRKPKVLIVDDIEYNHILLNDILSPLGFTCTRAFNGNEAIQLSESFSPDIILMDLKMPIMDGTEATRIIKQELKHEMPIVAISASGFDSDDQKRLSAGFSGFILKPFQEAQLLQTIGSLLSLSYKTVTVNSPVQSKKDPIDINVVLKEINQLDSSKNDLWEMLELTDWDKIDTFLNRIPKKSALYLFLKKAHETKDFMSLINLAEKKTNS